MWVGPCGRGCVLRETRGLSGLVLSAAVFPFDNRRGVLGGHGTGCRCNWCTTWRTPVSMSSGCSCCTNRKRFWAKTNTNKHPCSSPNANTSPCHRCRPTTTITTTTTTTTTAATTTATMSPTEGAAQSLSWFSRLFRRRSNNIDNGDADSVECASVQEHGASRSEDDPFWWSREEGETKTRQPQLLQLQQKEATTAQPSVVSTITTVDTQSETGKGPKNSWADQVTEL